VALLRENKAGTWIFLKFSRFIIFSILFHAILCLSVYLEQYLHPEPKIVEKKLPEPQEIERWVEPKSRGTGPSGKKSKPSESKLTLKDLGIQWDNGDGVQVPSGAGTDTADHGDGGAGSGILGAIKHSGRFRTLYERIDSALDYPVALAENQIQGTVTARLVFTSNGEFQKERSKVVSNSRFLKVLVHRLFRRVFDPNSVRMPPWHGSDELVVQCYFEFRLKSNDTEFANGGGAVEDRRVYGNKFYFSRYAGLSGAWAMGPIHGYYAVPAVGIDPDWFVEQMKPKKDSGDPLDEYRRDPEF
jgi:hypothetical protein